MIEFLISNPIMIVALVLLVMFVFISLFFKVNKKKKTDETNKVNEDDKVKSNEEVNKNEQKDKPKLIFKKKSKNAEKKIKKSKNKPEVQKVYERVVKKKEDDAQEIKTNPSISEDELLSKMQFVKTDKKVSKLVKTEDIEELQAVSDTINELKDENGQVAQETLLNLVKQKHGHFDKSRRLHRCVQEDNFDEMFCSHISDSYLNINSDRHLKINEDFETKLFDRTSKMLANSGAKVLVDESSVDGDVNTSIKVDKNYMKSWLEDKRREELANLISVKNKIEENQEDDIEELKEDEFNARSLLLGQILMNRKKTTKHWLKCYCGCKISLLLKLRCKNEYLERI